MPLEEDLRLSWDAVGRFVREGDVRASFELYERLRDSLSADNGCSGPADVSRTLAPAMLQQCLEAPLGTVSDATILYVCVLNRIFCLTTVPASQAQSLERRPGGLETLLQLYVCITGQQQQQQQPFVLPRPAQRQLWLCASSLALLVYDNIVHFIREVYERVKTGLTPPAGFQMLLTGVMEVLSDSRVCVGPVKRAVQRRHVQENLDVVLFPLVSPGADAAQQHTIYLQQAEMVDRAVDFLMESMAGEPQEVATGFWRQLPDSPFWLWVTALFQEASVVCDGGVACGKPPAEVLPTCVVDCVRRTLRCLTIVDEPAQKLLLSVLPPALRLLQTPLGCAQGSAVVASALESATEEVVLRSSDGSTIFHLISRAAELLVGMLDWDPRLLPEEAALSACEGVSALTQALQPMPIPVMEPDDDPEDFAAFTQSMVDANAEKAAATAVLRAFFVNCRTALLRRLCSPAKTAEDWETVAAYLTRSPHGGEEDQVDSGTAEGMPCSEEEEETDDFQVAFDELPLAEFTTYERLCKLLGDLPEDAQLLALTEGKLALVAVSAAASLEVLTAPSAATALPPKMDHQSALLPVLTHRYARATQSHTGTTASRSSAVWPVEALPAVLATLTVAMQFQTQERQLYPSAHVMHAAVGIVRTANRLVQQPPVSQGLSVPAVVGALDGLMGAAWRCLLLPGHRQQHWGLAADIAEVLELSGDAQSIPPELLNLLMKQDAHTQVAILSAFRVDTMESLLYLLRCVQTLRAPEDESTVRRMGRRLAAHASTLLSGASAERVRDYAAALDLWHTHNRAFLPLVLQLSQPLPLQPRAAVRVAGLCRFLTSSTGAFEADVGTSQLREVLARPAVAAGTTLSSDVAIGGSDADVERLLSVLELLLQPHPAFHAAGGSVRLLAVLLGLQDMLAGGRSLGSSRTLQLFTLAVQRAREVLSVLGADDEPAGAARRSSEGSSSSEDAQKCCDALLAPLSELGRAVLAAVPAARFPPATEGGDVTALLLSRMRTALDAHDIRASIKATMHFP